MKLFLSGATGQVGSAVLDGLLRAGHSVTALVRTPQKAEQVAHGSVTPLTGDLSHPDTYAAALFESEVIVHTAIDTAKTSRDVDRKAIDTFLTAARRRADAGLKTDLIYTSGVWVLGNTTAPADEDAPLDPPEFMQWRPEHEHLVLHAARAGVIRPVVIRPGIVYGGARGIIGDLLKDALNGLVRVVGDGTNHWACIYERDLADLYVRLLARPDATGVFHANDEADESVNDIVESLVRHATVAPDVRRMPLPEARGKLGPYADALALDEIVRSPRARALGWAPTLHSVGGNVARLLEEFRTSREAA